MRVVAIIGLAMLCSACSEPPPKEEFITLTLPPGDGPWQIWTYDEQPIQWETVEYVGNTVQKISYSVYIDNHGQFIHKNGNPIKTYKSESLFWGKLGNLITDRHTVIPRESIFSLNGKPLTSKHPLLLKEQLLNAKAGLDDVNAQ